MFRHIVLAITMAVCGVALIVGCNNPTEPTETPEARTVLFTEGFEGGLTSRWEGMYMISSENIYSQMGVSTEAAHAGTHSITTDSNMTALYHKESDRVESGISGVEFYMKAQSLGQINFGVGIGQNPGSSGAISPAFGIFFDPTDSIKCIAFCSFPMINTQTMIAPAKAGQWYKCKIEVNMTTNIVTYYIDDVVVHTEKSVDPDPGSGIELKGIDQVLVLRGIYGKYFSSQSVEGKKPYYVDDITLYTK